jgi:hypothetical protein
MKYHEETVSFDTVCSAVARQNWNRVAGGLLPSMFCRHTAEVQLNSRKYTHTKQDIGSPQCLGT